MEAHDGLDFIEPNDLANILLKKSDRIPSLSSSEEEDIVLNHDQILIVDVRGQDEYQHGHIKNAINIPSDNWSNSNFVDNFIEEHSQYKHVIMHCAKSQIRGPTCARILKERIANKNLSNQNESIHPSIYVLRNGFDNFSKINENNKDLIED